MIPESETLISLGKVPKFLQERDGRRPGASTVYRWISSGLHGVRLEVIYRAGRAYTSVEALRRFDEAVTIAKGRAAPQAPSSTDRHAEKAHQRAMRRLADGDRRNNGGK